MTSSSPSHQLPPARRRNPRPDGCPARSGPALLAADPGALARGAPPVAGRLAAELIARGSKTLTLPACARCSRSGIPRYRTPGGGMCKPCTGRQITAACAHCGEVKPVASRDAAGQRICERCRRHDRGHRRCGVCGQTASIAVRARGGAPDICTGCYQMPGAVCSVCGKHRECNFARSDHPVCPSCSPRAVAAAPAAARTARRRPAGPRARSATRATPRRCAAAAHALAAASYGGWWPPPGPAATTCATCAGLPAVCVCADCGIEDKLYEKGRCCRCSLSRRAAALLSGGTGQVPGELAAVLTAICSARNQRTALNWLRAGAGAVILADLAAGRIAATHEALDQHPRPRAAGYLRQMLVAGGVLPPRDEELARAEQWLAGLLASITVPEHRRSSALSPPGRSWRGCAAPPRPGGARGPTPPAPGP